MENTTENGLLSYENPNYHLGPSKRLDDALNSNTENLYDEIYQELDDICNMGHTGVKSSVNGGTGRKAYAALDVESMGVDITTGPLGPSNLIDNRRNVEWNGNTDTTTGRDKNNSSTYWDDLCDKMTENEDSVPHIVGGLTNDLYAVPVKKFSKSSIEKSNDIISPDEDWDKDILPPGWEKHEDNDGPYYWHIKSGTIQREMPVADFEKEKCDSKASFKESDFITSFEPSMVVTRSSTSSALDLDADDRKRKEELALKRRSFPSKSDQEVKERPIRFAVRSLGWVEIAEEDLTPERSSKAVNKCIVDLSLGKNDLLDVVGRWGDGKDLFMDLDEGALKLFDPENLTILNTQPIHTIRVWGVGRDNGRERDFAYVARDRTTRKHMCHVFRCDMPARTIANTLRDICKKIMIERSLQQNLGKMVDPNGRTIATRPCNLPTEHRRPARNSQIFVSQSFPTPMEEPKKILKAQYLGCIQVNQATGMEVLNDAIDRLSTGVTPDKWQAVNISIAPSMISVHHPTDDRLLAECRVRYLSFLGIGKNIKHCAFVMHTAQDTFMAHVFYCEPSSGALCKTIEAACKLRYQKCLDAHPQGLGSGGSNVNTPGSSIGAALKSIVGSLRGRKSKSIDS
ncbi:protein Fe65 homolog isoform X4 [Sitophilus oryzae]|uniref:Protein Fe65 homolog isoform X4 n=1 Tax=Sitophilus oryzae TaxID=7048 RepID=A0A6J2XF03_SITOR|nr:protein Fe65 homolog isoform X4 [Sitophilus oryzae]